MCTTVSASINPLPSDRLRCCERYIRCQRSLAVKPLTMSGSPVSVRRVSRSQVTHVPISNCSCSMCAMTVSKLTSTCRNNSCALGGDGRCASNGAFSTGVPVDWGLSQWPVRVDCRLSYTTGQATIARSAIVACSPKFSLCYFGPKRGVKFHNEHVCMTVCPFTSQKRHVQTSQNFLYMLRTAIALTTM